MNGSTIYQTKYWLISLFLSIYFLFVNFLIRIGSRDHLSLKKSLHKLYRGHLATAFPFIYSFAPILRTIFQSHFKAPCWGSHRNPLKYLQIHAYFSWLSKVFPQYTCPVTLKASSLSNSLLLIIDTNLYKPNFSLK